MCKRNGNPKLRRWGFRVKSRQGFREVIKLKWEILTGAWLVTFGCLLVLSFATSCTHELRVNKVDNKGNTLGLQGTGNGNGTGYGGKPTYYWVDPDAQCQRDNGSVSNVKGMITVGSDQAMTYYEGCEKKNGAAVPSQDVVFSAHNPDVIYYRGKKTLFEYKEIHPDEEKTPMGPVRQLVVSCDFTPAPVAMPGTRTYFSRINVTSHRWVGLLDTWYTLDIRYERVDLDINGFPIAVNQYTDLDIPGRSYVEGMMGESKFYEARDEPIRKLKSFGTMAEFDSGWFNWEILGDERLFSGGICFHR